MNPIQEFMTKARVVGEAGRVKELELALLKAENENAELRAALNSMQQLKEKYQLVVVDLMALLERHGLVS